MAAHQISTKLTDFSSGIVREFALFAASGLSLLAAAIHLWAVPEHLFEWWGYGAFFVALSLLQGLFAVALLRRPSRGLLLSGAFANLGVVAFYVTTRTAGIPFIGPHAGEVHAAGALDLTATVAELALAAALVALAGEGRRARIYVALGAVQALGTGLVLHALHSGIHAEQGLGFVTHWVQNSILALPLSVLALLVAGPLARAGAGFFFGEDAFAARISWALAAAGAYAAAGIPANALAAHHASAGAFLAQSGRDAGVVLGVGFLILLAVAQLRGTPWEVPRSIDFWRPRAATALVGLAAGIMVVVGPAAFAEMFAQPVQAQAAPGACSSSSYDRSYDVAAANVDIPYNRFAQTKEVAGETVGLNMDPNGQAFVLQGDQAAVENWFRPLGATPSEDPAGADNRRLRPRPLVIRANAGECVKVTLTNELEATGGDGLPDNPRVGIKVYGPAYDAQTSDGSAVGYNADTTVGMGETISYYWKAPSEEGTFLFRDQGALAGSEANSGSTGHGLHGAFVVEPAGSTWRDPETGQPLYAGGANGKTHNRLTKQSGDSYIDADIVTPGGSFRETLQISQDELPGGNGFAFNYGAEPAWNRIATNPAGANPAAEQSAPDAIGEETSLSSWTYGDPALIKLASGPGPWLPGADRQNKEDCGLENSCYVSNVTHAYKGDATKIRFAHAGVKETHVFHMHAHQWRIEPNDPGSQIIDSQTFGPGEAFTASLIGGAGSTPKTAGDSIFHCHLYPHFADGFWALFRVHDVYEDGTGSLPDGTKVRELKALPGKAAPAGPTAEKPGYPRFIPGKYGWRAPQPPGSISESNGQQDVASTVQREDLDPATRVVAGRPLKADELGTRAAAGDALSQQLLDKLQLEQQNVLPNAKPGAPFAEPCPSGAREVTYNVSAIQTDVVYNERGDHDTQGRIMVPTKDVEAILSGAKKPEPLFIRVNAGDCINFNLTNYLPNWYGGDAFVELAQTNMVGGHIHLVKFDVLASDGSSNGWNYQQAAFSNEQAQFNKDTVAGSKPCNWNGCRLEETDAPANYDPNNTRTTVAAPGQTISERWYADTELRTVFTHDHHFAALDQNRGYFGALVVEPRGMDFRNPKTGQYFQPGNGSTASAPTCGDSCVGTAAGAAMDIIGPGASDDFREFGIAIQDFVSLTKKGGDSRLKSDVIAGPAAPEEFPDADPGTVGINYRNAPFQLRETDKNGNPSDPAHVFSSTVHGDPMTPIMQTYSGDPVRVRAIQGSQEEQHVLSMNGVRWREEPDDPNSPLINAKTIGISEAFNFEVPKITCAATDQSCAGDYLYGGTSTDDLYQGAWGLLRARAERVPSLLPLPDNNPAATDTTPEPGEGAGTGSATSPAPPEAATPGNPCPTGQPAGQVKTFNVVAMQAKVEYNKQGDNDPHGLIYALAEDEAAIRSGELKPEPLVLRANQGDCVQVRLTNKLTNNWGHGNAGTDGDPTLPTEPAGGTRSGLRVSLNPQVVKYDVRGSDGAAVGYNRDSTVAPGDTRLYRWYADGELGTTNLTDWGDVRGHRHHGLFAGLNIEPRGATYHDPETGEPIKSGVSADIRVPGQDNDFREFTTFFQDGLNLRDAQGNVIEDPLDHPPTPEEPEGEPMDAEDMGEKGFNYASSPFSHRVPEQMGPDGIHPLPPDGDAMAHVFDSSRHGDPNTPIYRAFEGDDIRMRVLQGSDKPRQHSFQMSGASWKAQPNDPGSNLIGAQGGISVGRSLNMHLSGFDSRGDYRYGCGVAFHHLSGGLWGIVRVYDKPAAAQAINPTPLGNVDNPHAGGHPILPLEAQNVATSVTLRAAPTSVQPGGTTVLSGRLSATGGPLANRQVTVEQRPAGSTAAFAPVPEGRATTDAEGNFRLANVSPGRTTEYRAVFAGSSGAGLERSVSAGVRVVVMGETTLRATASPAVVFGQSTNVTGSLTEDAKALAGKQVTLEQRPAGQTAFSRVGTPVNTDANGKFMFSGIKPPKNTDYRVVFAGETSTGLKPSEATVPVKVRAAVSVTTAGADLKLGRSRPISGSVAPAHAGAVKLLIKRNGTALPSKTLRLDADSRFTYTYKPNSPGFYTVQATFAGDADHLAGSSATKSFQVIR
ncbi:hypothetical protein GBA63_01090 [Rubrobacter tropicus]|uniref:Plastocyanin-like domain-containing protein n=1 Tax=Rubrobacter tropicus TaxID=2653851 RepID=A0A6G8Q4J8_9ACTN|nr:hypothetical protein [Rubrobacter tropicus]QIN81373.1 hypothetical protein GBA63_01090 [Rubrobacter tropicus]